MARRHVPQGARGGPGGVDGGPRRDRGRPHAASAGSWRSSSAAGHDEGSAWPRFIRSLVERGLAGVSARHLRRPRGAREGRPRAAPGSSWQRCRVHLTRNAQDLVPRSARSMVASAIRSVIEQPDGTAARAQLDRVIDGLRGSAPRVADLLADAEPDLLAHFAFPESHRRQIRSTNPLERLNKEIKRRTAVVGIFPNRDAVIRLVGMILAEQDDEWQDGRRYFRPETMAALDAPRDQPRGGEPGPAHGELIRPGARIDALLHHVLGLDRAGHPRLLATGRSFHRAGAGVDRRHVVAGHADGRSQAWRRSRRTAYGSRSPTRTPRPARRRPTPPWRSSCRSCRRRSRACHDLATRRRPTDESSFPLRRRPRSRRPSRRHRAGDGAGRVRRIGDCFARRAVPPPRRPSRALRPAPRRHRPDTEAQPNAGGLHVGCVRLPQRPIPARG